MNQPVTDVLWKMILPLPRETKPRDRWTRWILRKAMEERLPAHIASRKDMKGRSRDEHPLR
jgi:asparagine synthase